MKKRNSFSILNKKHSGDFISSDTEYPLSKFRLIEIGSNYVKSLHLETVKFPSSNNKIKVELDPDGPSGPAGYIAYDTVKIATLKVVLENDVWWNGYKANGKTKIDLNKYSVDSKLTVKGITSGTFTWTVTSGSNRIELAKDATSKTFSSTITETNDNSIYVYAKAGSLKKEDITIQLQIDGTKITDFKMTVYRPKYTVIYHVRHIDWDTGFPPYFGNYGYKSVFSYWLLNQFKKPVPDYPICEFFPGKWKNIKKNSWKNTKANGYKTNKRGQFADTIGMSSNHPDTMHPQTPLGSVLIRTRLQEIRSGTSKPAKNTGLLLRTNTIRQYLDHGSIVTKGKKFK